MMFLKIANYEFKKNKISIILTMLFSFIIITLFWRRNPQNYTLERFQYYYFLGAHIGMLVVTTRMFTEDFRCGAIKILFTSAYTRFEVFLLRLLTTPIIAFVFFLGSQIVSIGSIIRLDGTFKLNILLEYLPNIFFIYVLASIMIGAYVGFVTYYLQEHKKVYVVAILVPMVMHYFLPFILFLSTFNKNEFLIEIIDLLPTKLLINWSTSWSVTQNELIIFLIWIIIFTLGVWFTIQKKFLKLN